MFSFLPVVSIRTLNSLVELNESLHGTTECFCFKLLKYSIKMNGLSKGYLNEGISEKGWSAGSGF